MFFFVDERYVALDHTESNFRACSEHLFNHVPIPQSNIYRINHNIPLEECAKQYEDMIKDFFGHENSFPSFDLILLGMGPDGHTASLFPGHPLLLENEKWIAYVNDSPKPPPQRITFTLPVINHAQHVAFIATGDAKKEVLAKIFHGTDTIDENIPSRLVRPISNRLQWFIDVSAGALLKNYSNL